MKIRKKTIVIFSFIIIMVMGWIPMESRGAERQYPNRIIQIVVCYSPGSTDMVVRIFTDKLSDYLGQPVSYVYKPGAAGGVGASFVAKAKPDGYTLMATSAAPIITTPLANEGLGYTLDNFVPILRLAASPIIVAVKSDSSLKTIKDVVEEAKKSPGKLTYSTSGVMGTPHIPMAMFVKSAGINITHVPTTGMAPAVTALLGGHVTMTSSTMTSLSPHIKSGALRPIATFQKERLKEYPNVPTFSESGYPVVYFAWYGLAAPKGIPKEVVKTVYTAFAKVVDVHKDYVEDRLKNMGLSLFFQDPEEFGKELKAEYEFTKTFIKDLSISAK